jgi:hypothetical protein
VEEHQQVLLGLTESGSAICMMSIFPQKMLAGQGLHLFYFTSSADLGLWIEPIQPFISAFP